MLYGGFLPHRPYLIVGPAGTGKTTMALQFLCEGVRRGERCLVVTLEEPPNEMRLNHRNLEPELAQVYVFDAIPDVMRYERAPFKDIAAVRQSVTFSQVPYNIRKTPELSSVEVTFTALEQTLKMEMARRGFQRIVIDSLTALQYFCMKGFDESLGAQTFLRFLSDLRVTTVLTVESPTVDLESPERLLARGEIRLFRWEHEYSTVRALGVEKFRGSEHDGRLHPYRIGPTGIDVNLAVTISRDSKELLPSTTVPGPTAPGEPPPPPEELGESLAALEQDCRDLVEVGVEVGAVRSTILEALAACGRSSPEEVARVLARARGRVLELVTKLSSSEETGEPPSHPQAMRRLRARGVAARAGIPPVGPPNLAVLPPLLERILDALEPPGAAARRMGRTPSVGPAPPESVVAPAVERPSPAAAPPPVPLAVPPVGEPEAAVPRAPLPSEGEAAPAEPLGATVTSAEVEAPAPRSRAPAPPTVSTTTPSHAAAPAAAAPAAPTPPVAPAASPSRPRLATVGSEPPPPPALPIGPKAPPPPLPGHPRGGAVGGAAAPASTPAPAAPRRPTTPKPAIGPTSAVLPPLPGEAALAASTNAEAPAAAPAVTKRRRKAPAGAPPAKKRVRKAVKETVPAAPVPTTGPISPVASTVPGLEPTLAVTALGVPAPEVPVGPPPPTPKPRKRAPRRKAPPVSSASPGGPPSDEERVAPSDPDVPAPSAVPSPSEPSAPPPQKEP